MLHLANGDTVNGKLANPAGRLAALLAKGVGDEALIEEAYLRCLARPPRPAERAPLLETFRAAGSAGRREAAEDLFWALLTSREFLFQH